MGDSARTGSAPTVTPRGHGCPNGLGRASRLSKTYPTASTRGATAGSVTPLPATGGGMTIRASALLAAFARRSRLTRWGSSTRCMQVSLESRLHRTTAIIAVALWRALHLHPSKRNNRNENLFVLQGAAN